MTPLHLLAMWLCLSQLISVTFGSVSLCWMGLSQVQSPLLLPNIGVFGIRCRRRVLRTWVATRGIQYMYIKPAQLHYNTQCNTQLYRDRITRHKVSAYLAMRVFLWSVCAAAERSVLASLSVDSMDNLPYIINEDCPNAYVVSLSTINCQAVPANCFDLS